MKTGTKILLGAGVVLGGAGLYLLSRPASAKTLDPKPLRGGGNKPGAKSGDKTPGTPVPAVFRLTAADAKTVACDLRASKNAADVRAVLTNVVAAVKASGAETVDLRSTGLTGSTLTVAAFETEVNTLLATLSSVPGFLWGQAEERIEATLSGLPACDAPMSAWEAQFGGGGVQAALRPPPHTLLQGLLTLRG